MNKVTHEDSPAATEIHPLGKIKRDRLPHGLDYRSCHAVRFWSKPLLEFLDFGLRSTFSRYVFKVATRVSLNVGEPPFVLAAVLFPLFTSNDLFDPNLTIGIEERVYTRG